MPETPPSPRRPLPGRQIWMIVVGAFAVGVMVALVGVLAGPGVVREMTRGFIDGAAKRYKIDVEATRPWTTLDGVAVSPGDIVTIKSAGGKWRIKPGCPLVDWKGHPDGTCDTPLVDGRILKEANRGALLWRPEGMQNTAIVAELGAPIRAKGAGRLQFQINDDSLGDNDGILSVEVGVTRF